MKRIQHDLLIAAILLLLFATATGSRSVVSAQSSADRIFNPNGSTGGLPSDDISQYERELIKAEIRANMQRLGVAGSRPQPGGLPVLLQWPTRKAPGLSDFHIGQISSYVDQDPLFPNQVLDWNCGVRTYDLTTGYNHQGVDINSFAFPWRRMYQNEVEAVAAAEGMIIGRDDGNFDQNCTLTTGALLNRVILRHADNSITWYLHLKNGSVTSKQVGDIVRAGEYLGIAGSSGQSSVPHLHLEVYDPSGQLQDPFQGPCNSMNEFSYWLAQEPYRNSRVNTLLTGSALPQFPACPAQEITNEKVVFQPLDTLITTAHVRDLVAGQEIQFEILRPDASTFQQWNFISPNTFSATFRSANWGLPSDAPIGKWTYRVTFNGVSYERPFYVGQPPNVTIRGRVTRSDGTPVSDATVVLMDSGGVPIRSAPTNTYGYFRFADAVIGQIYNFEVNATGLSFNRRNLMLLTELQDLDFTAR